MVSGIFYSLSPDRRTVKIVPYIDVIPEDKIRIDKLVCEEKRAEYVGVRYEDYRQRRSEALMRELEKLKTAQDAANEKAGYINFLDTWYTASRLTHQKIAIERQKLASISGAKTSTDTGELLVFDTPNETALREKIAAKKKEVHNLNGIDSDRGYSPAFWDFTRGEARLALQLENYSPMATKQYDYFVTPNRQIRNIQFDYKNNKLSRVITFYTRSRFRIMKNSRRSTCPSTGRTTCRGPSREIRL